MTTKDRILDAAERLFARDGFEATSLRAITAEAQVNLAAVNYHFQSKDALVQAVIGRRMGRSMRGGWPCWMRMKPRPAAIPLPLEQSVDAFMRPIFEIIGSHAHEFVPLIGRLYTEPGDFAVRLYKEHFEALAQPLHSRVSACSARSSARRTCVAPALRHRRMAHTMAAVQNARIDVGRTLQCLRCRRNSRSSESVRHRGPHRARLRTRTHRGATCRALNCSSLISRLTPAPLLAQDRDQQLLTRPAGAAAQPQAGGRTRARARRQHARQARRRRLEAGRIARR